MLLRRESVFMLLPDGSMLAQRGAGRTAAPRPPRATGSSSNASSHSVAGAAGMQAVHRLAGEEIVAGPRPGSELVEAVVEIEVESVAAPWNTEGDWGEQPPSLRYHQFYDARGTVTVGGTAYPFAGPGFPQPLPPPPRPARLHRPRHHQRALPQRPRLRPAALPGDRRPPGARPRLPLPRRRLAHDADVVTWPHLDQAVAGGERLTIELHAGRHKAVITAETIASAFVTPAPDGRTTAPTSATSPGR